MKKIGFIGLGIMGKHMSKNLLKAGYPLVVYDIVAEAVDEAVKAGAEKGTSPKDVAAKTDAIITMLPNSPHVKEVVLGKDGIIETMRDLVFQAIRGGLAGSTVMDAKAPMMLDRNFKPGFRINLHIKDLNNVLDTAKGISAPTPLTEEAMKMMLSLRDDGMGDNDHSALVRYYEKIAGIEVRR